MIITDIRIIQQSLHYQKEYHNKQVKFLKSKIESFEKFKKEIMGDIKGSTSSLLAQSEESQPPLIGKEKVAQMEILW